MYLCPLENVGSRPMISFQMGGVLELYPLGLKELAVVDCLVDRTDMIAPSSPHLTHTQASKTSLLRTFSRVLWIPKWPA